MNTEEHNRMMDNVGMDRRSLMRGALGLGGLGLAAQMSPLAAMTPSDPGRTLVVIQLAGGNDGLNTVVPFEEDAYHKARPVLRVKPESVLKLDDYRGFSPFLPRLHKRYLDGGLAIVEGVGYPNPNRSHFKSFDIWHAASLAGKTSADGWLGRLMQARYGEDVKANRVVHMGDSLPYSVHSGKHPAAAFSSPAAYRWVNGGPATDAMERPKDQEREALAFLRKSMGAARKSSVALRSTAARYHTPIEYPEEPLGNSLRNCAAIIEAGIGTRILSVEQGEFDTHNNQAPRHRELLSTLDACLSPFLDDLQRSEAGRKTMVLVFSEFGRRVAENASGGTDHGCAGPLFVAGHDIRPGLYGKHPSLDELQDGDLIFNTDFRSVYATAIESCFGVPSRLVLGEEFPVLGLLG